MSTSGGEVTPLRLVVMALVPTATPVARPPVVMVAILGLPDFQVTLVVRFFVLWSL